MASDDTATPWAAWLRNALKARGWSGADLGRTGIVTDSTISKWLRGANPPGEVETVIEIAHALGAPDAVDALVAAGKKAAAAAILQAIADAADDEMVVRIRNTKLLGPREREELVDGYRRSQAEILRYFELRLADAERHARTERRYGAPPGESGDNGNRAAL